MTTVLLIALAVTLCLTLLAWHIRHKPLLWIATAFAWGMLLRTALESLRA
ncbi:hypothetical protein KTD19_29960 [Burkholderia multivorans]|nr:MULTISPECIES: hypothetical protein [Burkholderia cepacia complex]MBU9212380.1 hypothetical protein [Burkholderia multivorans]MBU9236601.1 hypothetical protein [Burkholderia multivorans]MBU9336700.1 hypothetical protein [Burkholderia multivorans]MBU9444530.1 hypothetical protein [Burkholderia multivorans]MCA8480187.1 hypothetical protein [Burkholderia multivorans]